jgi:predicted alpha/beta hydrolase
VLVPDLRGHGASVPLARRGVDWSYDAIVHDVGRYVELARSLDARAPLVLAGHSLFGHAQLAWLGLNPDAGVDAVVSIAVEQWRRRHEPSRRKWWIKRALFWPTSHLVRSLGYVPARALRQGNNDEAATMWLQFERWQREDRWCSLDGAVDYDVGLASIAAPLLHVLSEGDRLYARPRSAIHFTSAVPHRELVVLGRDDAPVSLTKLRPNHMAMVTDPRSLPLWQWVGDWLDRRLEG